MTRVYALEKLDEVGEIRPIKWVHAKHFCDMFQGASDGWLVLSDTEYRARYLTPREGDDLRAALAWAFSESGDAAIGLALASAAAALLLGFRDRHWLETALANVASNTPVTDQARLWLWLGQARSITAPAMAAAAFERAIVLYRRLASA
jgi:non-specific serine/threonine protein kinase